MRRRRFIVDPLTVRYYGSPGWRTEWTVYDNVQHCTIAGRCQSRAAARWIARLLNADSAHQEANR